MSAMLTRFEESHNKNGGESPRRRPKGVLASADHSAAWLVSTPTFSAFWCLSAARIPSP